MEQETLSGPIDTCEISGLSSDIADFQGQNAPQTPLSEILGEIEHIGNAVNLSLLLNAPALLDDESSCSEISDSQLQALFDSHCSNSSPDLSCSSSAATENGVYVAIRISEIKTHINEVLKQCDDKILSSAAADFINTAEELTLTQIVRSSTD